MVGEKDKVQRTSPGSSARTDAVVRWPGCPVAALLSCASKSSARMKSGSRTSKGRRRGADLSCAGGLDGVSASELSIVHSSLNRLPGRRVWSAVFIRPTLVVPGSAQFCLSTPSTPSMIVDCHILPLWTERRGCFSPRVYGRLSHTDIRRGSAEVSHKPERSPAAASWPPVFPPPPGTSCHPYPVQHPCHLHCVTCSPWHDVICLPGLPSGADLFAYIQHERLDSTFLFFCKTYVGVPLGCRKLVTVGKSIKKTTQRSPDSWDLACPCGRCTRHTARPSYIVFFKLAAGAC